MNSFTRSGAMVLAAQVVLSALTGAAGAAVVDEPENSAVNYDAEQVPNIWIEEDYVTIAEHDRSEMASELEYYDDSGDVQELPAVMNGSVNNSIGVVATEISDSMFGEYPRKGDDDGAPILDDTEWTSATGASVSDADGVPAEGVSAIRVATNGSMSAGDTTSATYANQSITTDAEKRVPTVFVDVDTLGADTHAKLRFVDSDGDYKAAAFNASLDASSTSNVCAQFYAGQAVSVRQTTDWSAYSVHSGITPNTPDFLR